MEPGLASVSTNRAYSWYNFFMARREKHMRKLIEGDTIEEPVRRFLTGLDVSNEASVVEIEGRKVYILVRPQATQPAEESEWTAEKARRRYGLIDKKLDSRITPLECVELAELEEEFDRYRDRVAPLPIGYAREILESLRAGMPLSQVVK